jgi:hypothetical protein
MTVSEVAGFQENEHLDEEEKGDGIGEPSSLFELVEVGHQEQHFNSEKHHGDTSGSEFRMFGRAEIECQQGSGHQHVEDDGKAVGSFHGGGFLKNQNYDHTTAKQQPIDGRQVDLTF